MADRVLVTGGAGFIGSHLCERLLNDGMEVICLDNFNDFYDPAIKQNNIKPLEIRAGFQLVEGDIRNVGLVEDLFTTQRPDCVVHLAAMAGVRPSIEDPEIYSDINVTGTTVLLDTVRRHPVNHFIFGSSSSVYGAQEKVPFSEDDPVNRPISPYAATKVAGEQLCYTYHHLFDIPITCLRFFTVYGPRQRPEMAIHQFSRMIRDGQPLTLFGDGSSRRDYTYIGDIIDGIISSLRNPFGYEIFNLGESQTVSLGELVALLEGRMGIKARIERLPDQPGDVPITFADISRARVKLGYNPVVNIEAGIDMFIKWFLG